MDIANTSKAKYFYLIPSPADEAYGCTISTVGSQSILPDEPYPTTNHPDGYMFDTQRGRVLQEYQLLYIAKGKGVYYSEQGRIQVAQGSLILLRPGCWHSYKPSREEGWDEYFIGFSGRLADNAIASLFDEKVSVYNVGLNRELISLYQRAIEVASSSRPAAQQLLCGVVMHMIGLLGFIDRNETDLPDRLDEVVEKAKSMMQKYVTQNLDLEELAKKLGVSYSWFRKIFRDYTGYPPAKYYMLMKLRHAQYLLANSDYSIKEIAFRLGYKSTEYFHTTFKRMTGVTPSLYRRQAIGGK